MNRIFILFFVMGLLYSRSASQSPSLSQSDLDSLAQAFNIQISELTSPQLEERKRIRREMQQKGYAIVLTDVLAGDGVNAIISYLKTKLQIEFAISHQPLSLRITIDRGEGKVWDIPLPDDWTFPDDPWKKE
ncbi:MAG: hypothetical protein KF749_15235 [Bacteroidetes bacterium]|nr:hypothetical protein [Bacteroidota bacterium]MCW5897289.1 hypothetical protein [Bacteroidota bacterium]